MFTNSLRESNLKSLYLECSGSSVILILLKFGFNDSFCYRFEIK